MNMFKFLFEQDDKNIDTPESSMKVDQVDIRARKALDSVDDQIDALILRYEASSVREEPVDKLMESLKKKSLNYLFEQDDTEMPDQDAGTADDSAEETPDADAPTPKGSEKMNVDDPAKEQLIPDLDIDAFANRTVRLISNYKSLLRIEEAIINRIKNFLDENYGEKFVQKYIDTLEEQYGISVEEFEQSREVKDEDFAVGAFAGGTGGLGGGG